MQTDHTQETVFVYKQGNSSQPLGSKHLRDRLRAAQPDNDENAQSRLSRFLEAHELIETVKNRVIETYDRSTLLSLSQFVNSNLHDSRLPTTFLLNADVQAFAYKVRQTEPGWKVISIHSKECPNVKSTIKLIVNRFTESAASILDRRLTYDFNVLIDWLHSEGVPDPTKQNLTVILEDTEGFEISLLRDFITYMQSYTSQLSLNLVLNLTIPLALLEEGLSQSLIIRMNTNVIQGQPGSTSFITMYQEEAAARDSLKLTLSPALVEKILASDLPEAAARLRYAVLAYFAGNPLAYTVHPAVLARQQLETLRQLPSHPTDAIIEQAASSNDLLEAALLIPELQVNGNALDHVFDPNYRPLLEQALADPRIYVGGSDVADRMSVPISVLYQLSRESSIYINIYDLYCAFKETVRPIDGCKDWDKQSMAIFLESVTELKMLGILRDCKRKFECLEKVSWKGV